MGFEVETGNASPTANSYVAIADADAYHTLYQNLDWATDGSIPDATKQLALMHASKACDLLFGQQYLSMPATSAQAMLFPRFTFVVNQRQLISSTTIPPQLKNAVCELALLYLDGTDIYPTPNTTAQVQSESIKVGDITNNTTFAHAPNVEQFTGFWHVEMLLTPIMKGRGIANNSNAFGH
ncbi:DnaT-like ssDNA-binding protein [Sapientia aquatica]|jgi:hypothetical protein|uniref:Putative DnaT-like domain-containing protein n=1 Tax=Sapientia aquatica TaxID=1549640 RepID=A0A4R5VWB4_9BURK|nr:DnaT-like ssDNA-binding protein [Sapientia aquatica]TDK63548.1 hypothetical protein E2I14_15215 [Sapientia aquatica]